MNSDEILIIQYPYRMSQQKANDLRELILKQKETGVILLPHYCTVIIKPKDIDIKVQSKAQDVTFDKYGYANRIDLPWLRMDIYPPEHAEWGFFTDGKLEGVGRWKHDAIDHLYPFYGPESFDHNNITHWCPLGKLPEKEEREEGK